jgi:hypothetical protein
MSSRRFLRNYCYKPNIRSLVVRVKPNNVASVVDSCEACPIRSRERNGLEAATIVDNSQSVDVLSVSRSSKFFRPPLGCPICGLAVNRRLNGFLFDRIATRTTLS